MDFRTKVSIPKSSIQIEPFASIQCIGSCFANNIGKRFTEELFVTQVNPDGVMYNPASVFHSIERSSFIPDYALLTLGTNHVYILKETNEIVDNCQKRPHQLFREYELSIDECLSYLEKAFYTLKKRNTKVKIIVTVSPIRYAKYGFHESQLSKSTLLLATHLFIQKHTSEAQYFPAYELLNDELRDYRFYASDMLHPSEQAIEYIWERFSEVYFSLETTHFLVEWQPLKKALSHKALFPDSPEYKMFQEKTHNKLTALQNKYPNSPLNDIEVG